MSDGEFSWESIAPFRICISREHRFGTDAFLLADFANVRRGEAVCDFCSGCGILPLLWLRRSRAPASVYAVELLEQPYRQMVRTQGENRLEDRFFPLHLDLRRAKEAISPGSMDVVTCNPPYFREGTGFLSESSHRLAARHEVACALPDIAGSAAQLLKYGGRFSLCGRPQRLPDAMEALRGAGLEPKRLRLVQKWSDTSPWLFLLEGRKGGKPSLQVLPPLLMERREGGFTDEVLRIYGKEESS